MADKMLRGRAPLTFVRGTAGVGQHVYFSALINPASVDPDDRDRLVAENYLEWVVPDGDGWKLAEEATSGTKGDAVTVGSTAIADPDGPEADPGATNVDTSKAKADAELAEKRAAAAAKLPDGGAMPDGRASQAVWVEYLVSKGSRYEDVQDVDKDELVKLAKQQS